MSTSRSLPTKVNPLLTENIPSHEVLTGRRRLGSTTLSVKATQVGGNNSTKPKNLGTFDYAHLRAPLPKGITSGIFIKAPASYYLMRRSSDGYVSATGMFKASFPWAQASEEEAERKYIQTLPTTSPDETAGNVWIPEEHAIELAKEYQILPWITALLDNAIITPSAQSVDENSSPQKEISSPPAFALPHEALAPPTSTPTTSSRGRSKRQASPSKIASPKKAAGSTRGRKTSGRNASKASSVEPPVTSSTLQEIMAAEPQTNGETTAEDSEHPVVRVAVDTDVAVQGDVETTHTHVEVEMPAGSSALPLPDDTAAMIAKAKEMVEAATRNDDSPVASKAKKSKRKAEELEEEENKDHNGVIAPSKKARTESVEETETRLRKEKVQKRALIGISAAMAVSAMIPYFLSSL